MMADPGQLETATPIPAPKRVSILGPGQMGLVCAGLLAVPFREAEEPVGPLIRVWGHDPRELAEAERSGGGSRLEQLHLPDLVRFEADDAEAVGEADLIVVAIPVQFIRKTLARLARVVPAGTPVVSVSKGIENGTLRRPTEVITEELGDRATCVLSGPTIAAELARHLPATMVAASDTPGLALLVQQQFSTRSLRIYTSTDTLGVELAGAVKNVIAIAAGIVDGLGAGYNAKSALLARGLAEIVRLGEALGASRETFFGIAGVGDLATTCFSPEGRNRSCGEALGRGMTLEEHLESTPSVVEGVATARSVMDLAKREGIDMPIAEAVGRVLFEGWKPIEAIEHLMARPQKPEQIG